MSGSRSPDLWQRVDGGTFLYGVTDVARWFNRPRRWARRWLKLMAARGYYVRWR